MIYEVRTYQLLPGGAVQEFYKRFTEAYEAGRNKHSQIAGAFYTEFGPLNQVVTIWPYESESHRERIRGESMGAGGWPPKTQDLAVTMVSEIYLPFSFSQTIPSGKFGPFYEFRSYQLRPGSRGEVESKWAPVIEARRKLSPLVAALYSDSGTLNKFVHIWAYESLAQRDKVRADAIATKIWPPHFAPGTLVTQENKMLKPVALSPLQ